MRTVNNSIGSCSKHIGMPLVCSICESESFTEKPKEIIALKPIKPKPHFYAVCFEGLQQIASDMGYNLILHGSMNRDMDLVAIPWVDEPKTHTELLDAFVIYLGVPKPFRPTSDAHYLFNVLPGGRSSYVINLNRGGKYNGYEDAQYYLDISITPLLVSK